MYSQLHGQVAHRRHLRQWRTLGVIELVVEWRGQHRQWMQKSIEKSMIMYLSRVSIAAKSGCSITCVTVKIMTIIPFEI